MNKAIGELYIIANDCNSPHMQLGAEDSTGADIRRRYMAVP